MSARRRRQAAAAHALRSSASDGAGRVRVLAAWTAGPGVAVMALWAVWIRGGAQEERARPDDGASPQHVAREDFVGAEACGRCHTAQFAAWRESTHGRAGGAPGPETLIAPFDGTRLRFRDAVVVPIVADDGGYRFRIERPHAEPLVLHVDGVVGRGHMLGGGTQGFLARFPDGTVRFLPFDYSRQAGAWFCNTTPLSGQWTSTAALEALRADQGWVPINEDLRLTDCGDWPPIRVLGSDERLPNCQGCHGSRITLDFDTAGRRYRTRIGSLAVDCESCHGPGLEHSELARSGGVAGAVDLRIGVLDTLDADASLQVCFQCHAVKHVLRPDYLPGKRVEDHYSFLLPLVGNRPFHPDGRIRTFAYQLNHRASDCYLSGSMTCVDCHDPHGQGYRTVTKRPLEGPFDDGQCLQCHPSKAEDPEGHTRHRQDSPGGRCVHCHMPYLQQPAVGPRIPYARADHTIPVPRPSEDARLGIENACTTCHEELSADEAEAVTREWYGELKPRNPVVAELLRAAASGDPQLALEPGVRHPMAQVMSLDHLLQYRLRPDMDDPEEESLERIAALAQDPDPDVKAVALAALHLAAGRVPWVRDVLRSAMAADASGSVRARWVLALGLTAEAYRERGDPGRAVRTYSKGLEVDPRDLSTLLGLGVTMAEAGDDSGAVEVYRRAVSEHPASTVAWTNLGLALENLGSAGEAEAAYRRAVALDPRAGIARMNLGNILLRRGEHRPAIDQYRLAVASEPWLARAYFYLAIAQLQVGQSDEAVEALRGGLEFAPWDDEMGRLYRELTGQPPP